MQNGFGGALKSPLNLNNLAAANAAALSLPLVKTQ
jgi:hypothetical protein